MGRRTPLHAVHEHRGATFTDFAGWDMPVRYVSDIVEHHAVRQAAGLFDLCHMGEIEVTGSQASGALDHSLLGRFSTLAIGRARYTMICNELGGIIDDLVVYRLADDRYLVVANAANATTVLQALSERAASFDADVRDAREDWALVAVQGPASRAVVDPLTSSDISGLAHYGCVATTYAGAEVVLARTGYTGEDGFEIYCRPPDAVEVWEATESSGRDRGLIAAGLACRDTLRLEAGMPLYGHELTIDITPLEAGLGRLIAFDKGSFVGRDSLMARREAGCQEQLVGLVARSRRAPRAGYLIQGADQTVVGRVTSGVLSPTLGYSIALAYVARPASAPGTAVRVDVRGSLMEAEIVPLPFYRRRSASEKGSI